MQDTLFSRMCDWLHEHDIEPPPIRFEHWVAWAYVVFWCGLGWLVAGLAGAVIGFFWCMALFMVMRG